MKISYVTSSAPFADYVYTFKHLQRYISVQQFKI